MQFKKPKDDNKYTWTNHSVDKMQYYALSESLVKRVIRNPIRIEEGIVPDTSVVMMPRKVKEQVAGEPKKWEEEIWVMFQEIKSPKSKVKSLNTSLQALLSISKIRIISTWRYPGMSPKDREISIPDEILQDLENIV